jgi:small-conductance mechanosensitive channel/CRP-like cAMP-binding protein
MDSGWTLVFLFFASCGTLRAVTPAFWNNLLLAVSLGLTVAALLWLFRTRTLVRRIRLSALMTAFLGGLWLLLAGLGATVAPLALQIVSALALLFAANTLLQALNWLLWEYALGRRRGVVVPRLIVDVFSFAVLVGVALLILNVIFQANLTGLLVTSTVVSAVIGLALQDTLGNVIGGLALQLEHPFTVGDWVKVSDQEGQVMQMSWRSVTLRTFDNHNIFIPNGNIARALVINYSRPTPLQRMHASIHIAYGQPPGLVKQVLERAAAEAEGVLADPPPQAVLRSFDDSSIHYDLLYWITDYARLLPIHNNVLTCVWYALDRRHVTFPFPVRDVTVKMLGDDHEARVLAQRLAGVVAALRPLSVLAPLTNAQIEQLAQTAARQRFTTGERLVRQNEAGDSLFVITAGRVRVEKRLEDGAVIVLAHLGPDEFFGEMSLLTGERRSATVIAESETEVVLVNHNGLAPVIAADARIAEALSEALAARARNLGERVAAATAPLADRRADRQASDLLARIRQFFGVA